MSWTLPTPLLFAGSVALCPLAAVVRRPTSLPRLVAEAFGPTLCGRRARPTRMDRALVARAAPVRVLFSSRGPRAPLALNTPPLADRVHSGDDAAAQ
jgi:hypothetical protein